MTQIQRQRIKRKIIEDLVLITREIEALQILCKPIPPECALGDLARFELMNDQVVSEKTLREAQAKKNRLSYALSKVDTEGFGLCEVCDEEIVFERLLLLPESTHCIECALQQR